MQPDGGWAHVTTGDSGEPLTDFHSQVIDWYRGRE